MGEANIENQIGLLYTILWDVLCSEIAGGNAASVYTCQCEGCQIGQSSGVLLKGVAAFGRCPLMEVSRTYVCTVCVHRPSFFHLCRTAHLEPSHSN